MKPVERIGECGPHPMEESRHVESFGTWSNCLPGRARLWDPATPEAWATRASSFPLAPSDPPDACVL